jgi:hypothetical protein
MTGRRVPAPVRVLKRATVIAACTAVSASLLSGCGAVAGMSGESKDPIVVMTWAPERTNATNMPGMPAMAKTYARWVNKRGGINGRELKVLTCNERNDTVGAARCARRATARNVVAVVGSYSQHGRSFMPRLEAVGIPYIGGYGISSDEFQSPLSYPVNGGIAALLAGNGRQLARTCERVTLVRPDTVTGDQMPSFLNAGLRQEKRRPANDVRAPENGTDYAGQARLALKDAGAGLAPAAYGTAVGSEENGPCVTAVLGDRTADFFDSFQKLQESSPRVRIASVFGSVEQSLVNRTGGESSPFDRAYVTGWYPEPTHPRWEPMRAVVREYAAGDRRIDTADSGVQTTWIAYTVLEAAIESLGDREVTARAVRRALDDGIGDGVDTGGVTPKLSWRYEDLLAVRDFPRMTNAMVSYQEVRHGMLVPVRNKLVNVAGTLEARPIDG